MVISVNNICGLFSSFKYAMVNAVSDSGFLLWFVYFGGVLKKFFTRWIKHRNPLIEKLKAVLKYISNLFSII